MVKTLNTCSDLNIKYQKISLGCKNNFRASIHLGLGQVMMRVSIARPVNTGWPDAPIASNEWAIVLKLDGAVIETVKLKDLPRNKTVGVENIFTRSDDERYDAYLTMIKTSDSSEQPTTEKQLEAAWGNIRPMAIIFEVC